MTQKPKLSNVNPQTIGNLALEFSQEPVNDSPLENRVYRYSKLGLNLFPIFFGLKVDGLKWGKVARSFNAWHEHKDDAEKHVFTGRFNTAVVCGHTSGNLLVFDIDDKETAQRAYNYCKNNHPTTHAVKTRRGMHIYIRCTDNSIPSQDYTDSNIEIKGDGRYVVGANSVFIDTDNGNKHHLYAEHPNNTGIPTRTPDEIELFVKSIAPTLTLKRNHKAHRNTDSQRYDVDTRNYLSYGHMTPEGGRNESMVSACRCMLADGDDPTTIYQTLYPIGTQSGLSHNEVATSLNQQFKTYDPTKMSNGKQHKRNTTATLAEQFLNAYQWNSATTKAVMQACITMSHREHGKLRFRVASRELAELAHVGNATVSRHLKILKTIGILTLQQNKTTRTQYAKWNRDNLISATAKEKEIALPTSCGESLNADNKKTFDNGTVEQSSKLEDNTVSISKVLKERKALGYKTTELYENLLKQAPLTMLQIANRFNITEQSAYYHVKKLRDNNLARKDGKLYTVTENDIKLATLAELGQRSADKRKQRHNDEQFRDRVRIIVDHRKRKEKQKAGQAKPPQKQYQPVDYEASMLKFAMELGGILDTEPLPNFDKPKPPTNRTPLPTITRTHQTSMFDILPSYTV